MDVADTALELVPGQLGYLPTPTRGAAASEVTQASAAARLEPRGASLKVTFTSWAMLAVMPDSLKVPVGTNW